MSLLTQLPVHVSIFARGGYDDNVIGGSTRQGSLSTNDGVVLWYNLPGDRIRLSLRSGADVTYYPDVMNTQTNDVNAYMDLVFAQKVSTRLDLDLTVNAAYQTEPNFNSDVGVENQRANHFTTSDSASVGYHWSERFSTVTSDTFSRIQYDRSSLETSLNHSDDTIAQGFRFNLIPQTTVLVGEYRFEIVDYDSFPRDSTTHYALIGFDQSVSRQLSATVRGGATFRSYKEDGSRTDPHFEGSVRYSGARQSSVSWTASYGIEEPNDQGSLSRKTFRTGLQLGYGLASRISANVGGYYHHDQNQGFASTIGPIQIVTPDFSEDAFDVSAGVRYAIRGFLTFDLSYEHSQINSGQFNRDYSRNRYSAGFTFTY